MRMDFRLQSATCEQLAPTNLGSYTVWECWNYYPQLTMLSGLRLLLTINLGSMLPTTKGVAKPLDWIQLIWELAQCQSKLSDLATAACLH